MQITINNGTVTQIQETLTPVSGYTLPEHIAVNGGSYTYNVNTGLLTLTNLGDTTYVDVSISSFTSVDVSLDTDYIYLTIEGTTYKLNKGESIEDCILFESDDGSEFTVRTDSPGGGDDDWVFDMDGSMEYSYDRVTWYPWTTTKSLSSQNGKVYLRGTGNTYLAVYEPWN